MANNNPWVEAYIDEGCAKGFTRSQPHQSYHEVYFNIPYFNGYFNIRNFLSWIWDIENFFEIEDVPEEKMVKMASLKLAGHVADWWYDLQAHRRRQGKDRVRSWWKMKLLIMRRYYTSDHEWYLFREYHNHSHTKNVVFTPMAMKKTMNEGQDVISLESQTYQG